MLNTVPDNTNPIFSSYSLRSADFNENMDEYIKAPYDLYIEEQKKKQPNKNNINLNINTDAIKSIPDMPSFLEEEYQQVYKMPEWFEKLNVCTSEEIEEWKKQGGMGIAEAWNKNRKWASFAPYINTTKDAADAITVSVLLNRAKKGEELSYEQQEKLVDYLRDMKELQTRGFTFGGGTVNAILITIPYIEEFAIGLATSEAGVGLASLGKTLSSIGAKKAARKAVEAALKEAAIKSAAPAIAKKTVSLSAAKKIYKDTLAKTTMSKALVNVGAKEALKETGKALPHAVASSAKFGLTKMPETFVGGVADRQIATGVYVTDLGDAVFTDSEHLALSIMKSLGDSTFEALTETAGWTFSPVMGFFAKPVQKLLPKKFFSGFEKLVSNRYGMPAAKALRKYGYDGIIEEMGEEVLNRFLCQTFGINGLDEYNFDGFMNNVLYANNPSQWGQEALSFAVAGGGGHIVAGASSKIADEWDKKQYKRNIAKITNKANKYIQSPEQFYLDQGLIKIKGSQSVAEQKLRSIWTSQNIDEGLQDDILKDMSETEIRNILKDNIGNNNRPLTSEERIRQKEIKNEVYEKLVNANVNEQQAQNLSILTSSFFEKYARDEKSREKFDNFIDNLRVKFNIPVENIDVLKTGISYNQAVESAGADENEISAAQIEWQEKGTESKYFKKWFGDSKVVDENGKPLVVYHTGTFENVYDMTKNRSWDGVPDYELPGIYASESYEISATYGMPDQTKELYMSIKNPYKKDDLWELKEVHGTWRNVMDYLKEQGYDGVIENEGYGETEYIAFSPEQIKSVNNRGTFDKNNPNIYYQPTNNNDIVDLTNVFEKVPTFEEVRKHLYNILDNGLSFETKTKGYKIDIKQTDVKRNGKKATNVVNKLTKKGNEKQSKSTIKRNNKYLSVIEQLIQKSELKRNQEKNTDGYENNKKAEKPHVKQYYNFDVPVRIDKVIYTVRLQAEEWIGDKPEKGIKTLHLYNIYENKKSSRLAPMDRLKNSTREDNSNINKKQNNVNNSDIYFQEANGNENLMAGYTPSEVMDKLSEIYNKIDEGTGKLSEPEMNNLWAQAHIIEDAFDTEVNPQKYSAEKLSDIMLNVYYIMNNQNIPQDYIDSDSKSKRTYNDLKTLHNEKKEEKEREYRGYFYKDYDAKPIVTIMENQNASTALHEFSHLFLDMLNELAKVNDDAKTQLEAVNKWLGSNGEYTYDQHEKFANNFVAYLYKGKAPNKKLKTVFENYKEWLKSVYNQIMDIPDVDISEEVQQLFDNMFMNDTFYQERKQVNGLIKQAKQKSRKERIKKKPVIIDNSSLDDAAKKHKEYCYEILSAATGKSEVYLKTIFETDSNKKSFGKKREAIENLLDKVDDKITTKIGFKPEWSEFFTDPGVSYENDDTEGDYKLVEQAFDTIISKSFGIKENAYNKNQNEYAEYIENAIDKANKEYEVLIRSYKNNDRDIATSAIFEWLDDLDEEIRQDYEDKFIYDSGIIERNENVDRFDKAKRQILQKAMDLGLDYSINENEKYQELVKQVMQSLNFLHPEDKAKMTANILDINSVSMLSARLDNIMDIAKTMEDIQLRKNLEKEIHNELQATKNIKKNGRTVGKYDYKTNKLFEELRQLDRLSAEKANEYRLENARFAGFEENGATFREKLINKFLSYKADGKAFADTGLMKSLYDEIIKIKQAAKSAKSELDLEEKLTEEKDIDELINIVQNKKDAKWPTKAYVNMMGNLESTLNALFNKDIKERYGTEILYAGTQSQAWQYEQKQNFEKEVARIYNLPQWLWDKKILEYLKETHTYPELRRKYDNKGELIKTRTIDRTLTKMDIIQAYIWSKNETLEKRLINQFGEETLYSMFDEMSIDDVRFAELMLRTAQSFYPLVNEAFINKYGLDLPKVSCYFPSTPERGSEVDLYNEYSSKSLNNSFTKARAMSETQPMDFHNPVTTLYSHIDGVAKFVFMSESLDKANLRFKNNDLKRVIINKYGDDAFRTLEQILINTTYKKEAEIFNGVFKIFKNLTDNYIVANIMVKPLVGLKQLLSASNYSVDMPFMTWQMGFLKALAHPKETIDYMMNIPYLKARYGGSYSNEFLKQTVENSAFAVSKKLKDLCNIFIRTGDIGAIIFGGKPYIDYLINEKKMSEDEAIKQFIISTNRSQQSSVISSLSNFQVAMTRNPFGALAIAYKNSQQQYVRMCGDAIISVQNGDMTKTQCAKYLFQFGFFQPFLYALATSGAIWRLLFTGDDDDLWNDLKMSIFNLGSDSIPFVNEVWHYALNKMFNKGKPMSISSPLLGDVINEINRLSKEDISAKDYFEAIGYLMLHIGLGYNSKAITNEFSGLGDIVTGEPVQGLMKVAGYTDKRAKHIVGNE